MAMINMGDPNQNEPAAAREGQLHTQKATTTPALPPLPAPHTDAMHGTWGPGPYLCHGLVPSQCQEHAGAQLVFSQ